MISDSLTKERWHMGIRYLELGTFASLSVQLKNYQAPITFWQENVIFTFIRFWDDYSTSFTESSKFSDEWLLTFRIGDSFLRLFHLNGQFTPENHYQIGWLSLESHSFDCYYYETINDNNATALGLSTVVISQKALMVVQHCRLSYVREHVGHCFICSCMYLQLM